MLGPELHDKEAASTSLQPQENLDKDSTKPQEEPAAAMTTTTLVEHPVYFVSTVLHGVALASVPRQCADEVYGMLNEGGC